MSAINFPLTTDVSSATNQVSSQHAERLPVGGSSQPTALRPDTSLQLLELRTCIAGYCSLVRKPVEKLPALAVRGFEIVFQDAGTAQSSGAAGSDATRTPSLSIRV
jgi:hypothetical protein